MNILVDNKQKIAKVFDKNIKELFKFNKTRINQLLEIAYFSIIYMFLSYNVGHLLNNFFPKLDENKNKLIILLEILAQGIVTAIGVFYIRKIAKLFQLPFSFGRFSKNKTTEYEGEVMISIIFFATQLKIIDKIIFLHNSRRI
tara:strand:+ start:948 stop:1376 length:429 start_codon:yes stop_codon:yes gene_type:complete